MPHDPDAPSRQASPVRLPGEVWDRLELILADFEDGWRRGGRPILDDYLADVSGRERSALLAELAQEELEFRISAGEPARVEDYLERYPQLRQGRAMELALVVAEFRARRRRDPDCDPGEYLQRFAARRAELEPVLEQERAAGRAPHETPLPATLLTGALTPAAPTFITDPPCLLGEYEVGEKLGGGGMGRVYRARHRRLGKPVALKLLAGSAAGDPERVARFLREMRALGSLKHPHVIEAHDAGEHNGVVYLAMELVEGTDLDKLVRQRGPLPIAEACDLARQAALGLQHLHEHGLVHRDLKPSNLIRAADGVVKVLDLGLARWWAADGCAGGLTESGQGVGTPDYLAPEQVQDAAAVDVRADLYGLGGTLFFLLTGQAPFAHHRGLYDKLDAHRNEPARDVRLLRAEVPVELAELVGRLLAKKPQDRPATPAEVAAALSAFTDAAPTVGVSPPKKLMAAPRRAFRWWMALAAGLLLAGLLGLGTLARRDWSSHPPPERGHSAGDPVAPSPPAPKPLSITLRVFRLTKEGFNYSVDGELGETFFRVPRNNWVGVDVSLSEPAYVYLIAFNPADKPEDREQPVPRKAAADEPKKRDHLPLARLFVNDGEGLQALAVVASRRPLPPYTEWLQRRPWLRWKRAPATSGVVWRADGKRVDAIHGPRIVRAEDGTEDDDKELVDELARRLKGMPEFAAVAVMGFAVDPPE
jgi:serine/threonine protein kinase